MKTSDVSLMVLMKVVQQNINEVQFLLKQTQYMDLNELEHRDQLTFKSLAARDTSVIKFTQYKVISFEDN